MTTEKSEAVKKINEGILKCLLAESNMTIEEAKDWLDEANRELQESKAQLPVTREEVAQAVREEMATYFGANMTTCQACTEDGKVENVKVFKEVPVETPFGPIPTYPNDGKDRDLFGHVVGNASEPQGLPTSNLCFYPGRTNLSTKISVGGGNPISMVQSATLEYSAEDPAGVPTLLIRVINPTIIYLNPKEIQ